MIHPTKGRRTPRAAPALAAGLLAAWLALGACSLDYADGQYLESRKRWEEAAIAYHLAVIDDPGDAEYREALERANKVVARENFELYRDFLAKKAFRKAYQRLSDAARQDPGYAPVQEEMAKWQRVLVGGQVHFDFSVGQSAITLADEIKLIARINTPNPGETLDAEIDIDTGTFFAEDLLYDRPNELLAYYSLNSIGVRLVYGRSRIKKFTSRDYQRFITVRTPILDDLQGTLAVAPDGSLSPVGDHRGRLPEEQWPAAGVVPQANPHYRVRIEGSRILVDSPDGRTDFTPRFLYVNRRDRRVFIDFGRYEVRLPEGAPRWTLRRLPLAGEQDYFGQIARNIALQPYFFYREGVFAFVPAKSG
jgi:hypothetical protein